MHESGLGSTDTLSQLIVAALLVAMFGMLALEKAHRVLVVLCSVALLWAITYLTPYRLLPVEAAIAHIDLNVLLLLAAMMALVGVLKETGVFGWAVERLLERFGSNPARAIAVLWWFTGIASAFLDNAPSNAVSRSLGYEANGFGSLAPDGVARVTQQFRMTAEGWHARPRPPVTIEGLDACRELFGAGSA